MILHPLGLNSLPPNGRNLPPANFNQPIPLRLCILQGSMFSALQQSRLSVRHPPPIINKNAWITRIRFLIPVKADRPVAIAVG